ncbi:hypothetical protein QNH14_17580 [Apirhabdus apintestini]|nr:hypothetical protein QNH14_17580 [Enterobacteriaceae bacterium CA-0114]
MDHFLPVVDNNRNSWTGSVTLFSRMPAFIVALTVITLLTLFISLITFGHYTRRINVGGEVIIYPHPVIFLQVRQVL